MDWIADNWFWLLGGWIALVLIFMVLFYLLKRSQKKIFGEDKF
jgi:flagellar biogenesis protein FliO